MIKWNYFLYRFSYSHLTIRKCKKRKRRERERDDRFIFRMEKKREENVRDAKEGKKMYEERCLVRRGAGTGTLENRMEWSKLFKASGRRPREEDFRGQGYGIRHPVAQCFYRARTRVRTYTQACKRASRTFAFESCATYINWLSFSSIVVRFLPVSFHHRKCSFVLPSRVSFFTFLATNFPTEW